MHLLSRDLNDRIHFYIFRNVSGVEMKTIWGYNKRLFYEQAEINLLNFTQDYRHQSKTRLASMKTRKDRRSFFHIKHELRNKLIFNSIQESSEYWLRVPQIHFV